MKKMPSLFLLAFFPLLLLANIAQPGIYQAGGTQGFTLLHASDSAAFKQISMAKEEISILLYPGFAVVKGSYWMANTTDSVVTSHIGYPVNHIIQNDGTGGSTAEVWFPEFYGLKALLNGQQRSVVLDSSLRYAESSHYDRVDWYVWEASFAPQSQTLIEVYFIVNTNEAQILQGYDKNYDQVFMYLLESGSVWKGPIGEGVVKMKGMDGVQLSINQRGSTRLGMQFLEEDNLLFVQFNDLIPEPGDNIILRLDEKIEGFYFDSILADSISYYDAADSFANLKTNYALAVPANLSDPLEVTGFSGGAVISFLMMAVIYAPIWGSALLILLVGMWFWKRKKKGKMS